MLMMKALNHRPIFRLWIGQALSSIGDEIYRVGLTWLAVQKIGVDTGYLSAAQAAALMILSFVGGKWADHRDPLKLMFRVDLMRAFIVLIPVIVSFFMPVPFSLLVVVAISLSGLGAFFDPALQTLLPKFCPDRQTLRAATGLMSTTIRMGRMIGPGIVGLLAGIVPPLHFFSLDSVSFLISALFVRSLGDASQNETRKTARLSFSQALMSGFQALQKSKEMTFVVLCKAITTSTWNIAYGLGFALRVQELAPNDTKSFGFVIAAYGIGNFLGALYFGNLQRNRPALMMFAGYIWLGVGFILTAFCPTIVWILPVAFISGFSGTMNEVTFADLVQSHFQVAEISRIFRLRAATDTAATLLLMLLAPIYLRVVSVQTVFAICGVAWVAVGITGLGKYSRVLDRTNPN